MSGYITNLVIAGCFPEKLTLLSIKQTYSKIEYYLFDSLDHSLIDEFKSKNKILSSEEIDNNISNIKFLQEDLNFYKKIHIKTM